MKEKSQKLFQPFTIATIKSKAELIIKVADKQHLDSLQAKFFIDLITFRFPHAVESYMITWAKRILMYSEYDNADGDLRKWMIDNPSYIHLNNERDKERYYHLMTIDNGLNSLDEKEQEEFDGLEKSIGWEDENE